MAYSLENIAAIVKGSIKATNNPVIEHLLIDSRKIMLPESSLFIALKGARRNGHQFIREVYQKGIRNFLVSEETDHSEIPDANIVLVADTLQALQTLAASHRKQFDIPVIGITGSNGKTIVKEWLNQLLESDYQIVRSPRSYNSQIGVPLSVWQINASHTLAIFEAGISETGEMSKIEKVIQPTIGIFTNIGEAHSEGFINLRQKINEKLQLFTHVQALIYCKDDPSINEGVASLRQQLHKRGDKTFNIFSWSMVTEAELKVLTVLKENGNTTITANYKKETIEIKIPFYDDASIENAIHCWCLLLFLNTEQPIIQEKMLQLSPVAMRLELRNGINNCSIINDAYSADLSSLRIALDFLAHQQQHPGKTVILSDILQSGKPEKELYREVANALQQKGVNRFVGIGKKISLHKNIFEDVNGLEVSFYESVDDFIKRFHQFHCKDETILVKGARVYELEQIYALLEQKVHQTIMEIDLDALVHNLRQFQSLLRPSTKVMAMVKAFSYGSGGYEIANALQFHKVDYLAVAYTDEGIELRKGGITLPIMVMNVDESAFDGLINYNLEPELYSPEILTSLRSYLRKQGIKQFPVHIELETGMNRLGFSARDIDFLTSFLKDDTFRVQSVFTHLVAAEDNHQDEFTTHQSRVFDQLCVEIQSAVDYSFIKHVANTSGIERHPGLQYDMVRLGIGLYGIRTTSSGLNLREVSTLKSTIAQIKYLQPGESVSYGRKGLINYPSTIATVRIGYADGYPRSLSNGVGKMMVAGTLVPVVGMVCMDMTMIDITGMENIHVGDEVIVFGNGLPVTEVATWAGTIPYEILTGVSQRVKRVYFEQ